MHAARSQSTAANAHQILLAAALAMLALAVPPASEPEARRGDGVTTAAALTRPYRLDGDVADLIVRVRGTSICSGTPITGTRYVVTAAHCILDSAGSPTMPTVVRNGADYTPLAVLVEPRHDNALRTGLDAAVLIMDRSIPGPGATLGDALAPHGVGTLAGFQPIDTDGTLLRGTSYHDRPLPQGAVGGVIRIESKPAGCAVDAATVTVALAELKVPCGLVPGASGGGLFTDGTDGTVLLAVISTVTFDLTSNGLTPLSAVWNLMNHPDVYTHVFIETASMVTGARPAGF